MKYPYKYNIQQQTTVDYTPEDIEIKKENRTLVEIQNFGICEETNCGCWNNITKMCDRR